MNKRIIQNFNKTTVACLAAGAVLIGFASGVQAQTAPTFGSVNVQQVLQESKARQRDEGELRQIASTFTTARQQLQENSARFLAEAEVRELAALYEKVTPTDADKKRRTVLEEKAASLSGEKRKLENTASPTDDNKKRYATLADSEQKGAQVLQAVDAEYQRRIDQRNGELSNKILNDVKAIITRIAQERKLSVVFDSGVAIYTANDITADVVKQLNK